VEKDEQEAAKYAITEAGSKIIWQQYHQQEDLSGKFG
jgi:hypothetical protein